MTCLRGCQPFITTLPAELFSLKLFQSKANAIRSTSNNLLTIKRVITRADYTHARCAYLTLNEGNTSPKKNKKTCEFLFHACDKLHLQTKLCVLARAHSTTSI